MAVAGRYISYLQLGYPNVANDQIGKARSTRNPVMDRLNANQGGEIHQPILPDHGRGLSAGPR